MYFLGFNWNPNDTLFNLGFIQIKYYNSLWIAAFILGWYLMKSVFVKEKKPLERLDSLFVYCVLSIMLGARLGHVFFYDWAYYSQHLVEILLPIRENPNSSLFGLINGYQFTGFTGLASHGAALAAIGALYYFSKKFEDMSFLWLIDRITIPAAIGAAFIRIGNFFNSEINGKVVDESFIFATRFIRDSADMPGYRAQMLTKESNINEAYKALENNPQFASILEDIPFRHPAQLYEAFAYLIIFAVLYFYFYERTDRKDKPGFMFGFWLASFFSFRFVVEYFKKSQGGFEESLGLLSTGQWLSIPLVLAGLYLMFKPREGKSIKNAAKK
ncbi:MAG: prolipoprotein diacylglyceryl transferase [Flavobacteriaceae bacterium]|jgi:prolipoprotein diacylglyceryl transferase|nr:prolipoprotein diacylglyceryl transferase [Flavobacteriaceae bacterium]